MKKKILFPLVCVMVIMMVSCFPEPEFIEIRDFARIVTVNRNTTPVQLEADYTGEVFRLDNLTVPEQLGQFGIADAERAFAYIHYELDGSHKSSLSLSRASKIKVSPVWNKALPENNKIKPLTDLYRMQLENNWRYPMVWLAGNYLNISPVIRSMNAGSYYLVPKAVYGDTLRFDMAAEYTESTNSDLVDFINFDLTTLVDTLDSDETTLAAVRSMLGAIEAKDSVCVVVVSEFREKGFMGADTIVKIPAYTGYSNSLKSLLK